MVEAFEDEADDDSNDDGNDDDGNGDGDGDGDGNGDTIGARLRCTGAGGVASRQLTGDDNRTTQLRQTRGALPLQWAD